MRERRNYQISDGSAPGPHGAEGSMAWGVQKREGLLTVWHFHLKSTDMLHASTSHTKARQCVLYITFTQRTYLEVSSIIKLCETGHSRGYTS